MTVNENTLNSPYSPRLSYMPELELYMDKGNVPEHIRLLLQAITSTPGAADYYLDLVKPLQQHDRAHSGNLMGTLSQYLYHGANATHTARALYLHRSTLLHRLGRISSLASLDLSDPYVRLALWIAVLLSENS